MHHAPYDRIVFLSPIIGPYWFEEDGKTVTINQVQYCSVIDRFAHEHSHCHWLSLVVFIQDEATPHTANETIEHLYTVFGDCNNLIGVKLDIEWASYSPDLNPLVLFSFGVVA